MPYPGTINSLTAKTDGPDQIIYAAHMNAIRTALLDMVTILGDAPQGNLTSIENRLDVLINDDGKLKPQTQLFFVGKSGCQYSTIQSAVDAISDASSNKIYTIFIFPGNYTETVTLKDYVNLVGLDRNSCKITAPAGFGVIAGAGSYGLSNLQLLGNANEPAVIRSSSGTTTAFNCLISAQDVKVGVSLSAGSVLLLHCRVYPECTAVFVSDGTLHARHSQFQEANGTDTIYASGGHLQLYHNFIKSAGGNPVNVVSPADCKAFLNCMNGAIAGNGTIYDGAMDASNSISANL